MDLASEPKQRTLAKKLLGDNLEAETTPMTFSLKPSGEIRAVPLVFVPNLQEKVLSLVDQNLSAGHPWGSIERIRWDPSHWNLVKPNLDRLFLYVILPKLMCGQNKENVDPNQSSGVEAVYCYFRKGEYGDMVACDNPSCKVVWFHFECVQLTTAPQGEWFCPECK